MLTKEPLTCLEGRPAGDHVVDDNQRLGFPALESNPRQALVHVFDIAPTAIVQRLGARQLLDWRDNRQVGTLRTKMFEHHVEPGIVFRIV
jgi:hypothetical protein